jgi:Cu/Ag efflux pump CusA
MPTNTTIDTSDNWSIEEEQLKIGAKITATHDDDDVDVVVKEYPNGVGLRLQEPANLPGGYDVVYDAEFGSLTDAIDELERFVEMYDEDGEWNNLQEAPLIQ